MTLTSLLAFVSGAVMARFKEPTLDKDHRIEELETVCNRLTATLRATTEQMLNTRLENEALRINLYGVYPRPLSQEQQAEFGRQFAQEQRNPQMQMQAGLAYPVPGHVQRELSEFTNDWRSCTCVPSRADMFREYDLVFGLPRPPGPPVVNTTRR
jgi:hypothetical protein